MSLEPQTLQMIEVFGPYVLGAIGIILTTTFGAMSAVLRYAWKLHQKRMEMMAEALTTLAKALSGGEEKVEGEHRKIWESVQGLRAELQMANRNTDTIKTGLLKVEGALENHRTMLYQHIEKLGIVDGKLSKLFQFVDAPKRATD